MIAEADLSALVASFEGVELAEVNDRAALLDRRDRKYLVPVSALADVVSSVDDPLRALDIAGARRFRYETTYLDTPELTSYRDAARGRPTRWKVRLRTYCDSGESWLEVKVRDRRGNTVKHRNQRSNAHADLVSHERFFVASWVADVTRLRATATTTYERVTLLDRAAGARTTIDLALRCSSADGRAVALPTTAVVETKTTGRPSSMDRALWVAGHRPLRFSKYCTGLAAVTGLPANRWHRTLQRAFDQHDIES